jgi:hypothetical protein
MLHRHFYEFPIDGSITFIFFHTHQLNLMVFTLFTRYKAVLCTASCNVTWQGLSSANLVWNSKETMIDSLDRIDNIIFVMAVRCAVLQMRTQFLKYYYSEAANWLLSKRNS